MTKLTTLDTEGKQLLEQLLAGKTIVLDAYGVPANTAYYDACNTPDPHIGLYEYEHCPPDVTPILWDQGSHDGGISINNWYEMERHEGPYEDWQTFQKWIVERMRAASYITTQALEALSEIIHYMEKN